jgi:hypothetical protein
MAFIDHGPPMKLICIFGGSVLILVASDDPADCLCATLYLFSIRHFDALFYTSLFLGC